MEGQNWTDRLVDMPTGQTVKKVYLQNRLSTGAGEVCHKKQWDCPYDFLKSDAHIRVCAGNSYAKSRW